jgi:L-ascorbate metabolism protein UlaG (beta-lactamase superfamily)
MRIRWFGQSAFLLSGAVRVAIDPFAPMTEAMRERGFRFDYPPIENVEAELVLITHEHFDHNAVEAIAGDPQVIRSTAGTFDSALGQVVAVASEHDEVAGTKRGPNTIFVFALDGLRVCHLGDFGQPALRPEQREAIGEIDLLLLPVGGGSTVGGAPAAAIVRELEPRLVVPMHYRTESADFLEPPDEFLAACEGADVHRFGSPEFEADELLGSPERPTVALPAAPRQA